MASAAFGARESDSAITTKKLFYALLCSFIDLRTNG